MPRGSIVKKRSGNYAIRYYGLDGRRYFETIGRNRKDAERALTDRLGELDRGTWRRPSSETLEEYGNRWVDRRRARLAPSTLRGYEGYLRGHVYPALGACPLTSLRPEDFDDLAARLERSGMPAGSVRNCFVPVKSMLSDAVRLGLLPANPATRVDLPPAPSSAGKELTHAHAAAIRAALVELAPPDPFRPDEPDMLAPLAFDVAIATGLRWSELAGLRWRVVDFDARAIRVDEAVVLGRVKRPKSGHIREVPMFRSVERALRELAGRALERGRYGPDEVVLPNVRGGPLDHSDWNHRVWKPALTRAKLAGVYRWHDLRHTAVSRLVEQGADIAVVQAVAGHASAATTLAIYTHLRDDRIRRAASQFDPGHHPGTAPVASTEKGGESGS